MKNNEIINKVVKFSENIVNGYDFNKSDISKILNLSYHSDSNLSVYRGILSTYYFYKFQKLPLGKFGGLSTDERFLKCVSLLNGNIISPSEIGGLFLSILTMPDDKTEDRDALLGSFYGSLWPLMNNPENLEMAVNYGVEIAKAAFSTDKFNFFRKIKLKKNNAKVINLAGSGKKEIKLLNISSMTAVILAAISRKTNTNIIVEKTISRATSSVTGSGDIFESMGVNLNMSVDKMAEMSLETRLGVFDIDKIVPRLNHVYDGRLYNIQVFAGLIGGAAIANPIDADLINYGLTRGSSKLCLTILSKLFPDKNIIILQGKNLGGRSVLDQISIAGDTEIAQNIAGNKFFHTITPKEFGFNFKPFKYIQTEKSSEENIKQFIVLLAGKGHKDLKQAIAMEVSLNLYGLGIVNDLRTGADLALEVIRSGMGVKIIKNLISDSSGDMDKFNKLLRFI